MDVGNARDRATRAWARPSAGQVGSWPLLRLLPLLLCCRGSRGAVLLNIAEQLEPLRAMQLVDASLSATCACECLTPGALRQPANASCGVGTGAQGLVQSLTVQGGVVGSLPMTISSLWALTALDMSHSSLAGPVPSELGFLADLVSLDLSGNSLSGALPETVFTLTKLTHMDLQDNSLEGDLAAVSQLAGLRHLSVGGNRLHGSGGASLAAMSQLHTLVLSGSTFEGSMASVLENEAWSANTSLLQNLNLLNTSFWEKSNPPSFFKSMKIGSVLLDSTDAAALNLSCPSNPTCIREEGIVFCQLCSCSCGMTWWQIMLIVVGAVAAVVAALAVVFCCFRPKEYHDGVDIQGVRRFSMPELEQATGHYSHELGAGGFGKVYKGQLATGEAVAVKMTKAQHKRKERDSLCNEVLVLSGVNHAALVRLLGYCSRREDMLLVYEFIARGSVEDLLKKEREAAAAGAGDGLSWAQRLRIAHGAAQGIDYLHSMLSPPILHRDIKSANILVDERWHAKVADFGLSKMRPEGQTMNTMMAGTVGYMDPAFNDTYTLTAKSDVYSFGVVMLELATSWRVVDGGRHIRSRINVAVRAGEEYVGFMPPVLQKELSTCAPEPTEGLRSSPPHGGGPPSAETTASEEGAAVSAGGGDSASGLGASDTRELPRRFGGEVLSGGGEGAVSGVREELPVQFGGENLSGGVGGSVSGVGGHSAEHSSEASWAEDGADTKSSTDKPCAPLTEEAYSIFVQLAMACTAFVRDSRPTMGVLAKALGELRAGKTELAEQIIEYATRSAEEEEEEESDRSATLDGIMHMAFNTAGTMESVAFVTARTR